MVDQRRESRRIGNLEDKARLILDEMKALLAPSPTRPKITVLADMIERGDKSSTIDGYPAGSGGGGGSRGSRSILVDVEQGGREAVPVSSSTEAAMFRRADDERADPIGAAIEDLLTRLVESSGHARVITKKRFVIMNAGDSMRGHVSTSSDCHACHRVVAGTPADPLVSAYCRACRKAWERAGYPDRLDFERTRRGEEVADDGEEWRIKAISDLQERGELPAERTTR